MFCINRTAALAFLLKLVPLSIFNLGPKIKQCINQETQFSTEHCNTHRAQQFPSIRSAWVVIIIRQRPSPHCNRLQPTYYVCIQDTCIHLCLTVRCSSSLKSQRMNYGTSQNLQISTSVGATSNEGINDGSTTPRQNIIVTT